MVNRAEVEKAIAEEAKSSRSLRAALDRFTDRVRDEWKDRAPVDEGTYRDSIKADKTRLTGDIRKGAAFGSVFSDDDPDKVAAIEYGTSDTEEFAPLRKTLAQFEKN